MTRPAAILALTLALAFPACGGGAYLTQDELDVVRAEQQALRDELDRQDALRQEDEERAARQREIIERLVVALEGLAQQQTWLRAQYREVQRRIREALRRMGESQ